nr:DUF2184 domain-containing protein [Acinetobacter sp. Marseille-Q1620]
MPLDLNMLAQRAGIHFMTGHRVTELTHDIQHQIAMDAAMRGMDAALITSPNGGVPALFTTYIDPKVIDILVEPMKMAQAFREVKKGDWTSSEVRFIVAESTGETSSYGDFNENGMSGVNTDFPARQPYHYQNIVRAGEREAAIAGAANLDWVSRKQIASVLALNKFQNKSYIYGVSGLKNYGMINDPNLLPSITSQAWDGLDGQGVYDSIQKLFKQLVKQANGYVDRDTAMTMLLSSEAETHFTKTNGFNVNVSDQLKKNFPNLKTVTVPEYETAAGQLVQLVVDEFQGQPTAELSFTEKMRVHPLIQLKSGFEQKRSQGTNGAIIYRPMFIASMLVS